MEAFRIKITNTQSAGIEIPTPKELKEMRLREALRQLEEISDFDDQECEQLDLEFKAKNIFK